MVRSFTLTDSSTLNICYSKEVPEIECTNIEGADRNLRNLTIGNHASITQYDLSMAADITENTRSITRSFKRSDIRVRKEIAAKYGKRRKNRINQLMHHVSKAIVKRAIQNKTAIVFEDIRHIRRLYQRGNNQGKDYRSKLNGWSFAEIKREIEYKAAGEGVKVLTLTKGQTRGTSQLCPRCGKRLQGAERHDFIHKRQLWCHECKRWMDRDVVAAMNIAKKGGEAFHRSKGLASEAMVQELSSKEQIILKVDASKLSHFQHQLRT